MPKVEICSANLFVWQQIIASAFTLVWSYIKNNYSSLIFILQEIISSREKFYPKTGYLITYSKKLCVQHIFFISLVL